MNSTQPSAGRQTLALRDRVAGWRKLLDRCGRKPTRKRVHALRVVTLRIQAELEHDVAELPHASHQAQAMLRFGKLAEKLRQVLGPVREIDVWVGKLQSLRASLGETAEYVPRSTRDCIRQIEALEDRLKKKRGAAGEKLIREIDRRRKILLEAGDEIHEEAHGRLHGADANAVDTILKQFAAVAADFPAFDEENLHDFRKRIKKVRYMAEINAAADPACGRIAAQVKKLQTAIGEWHDWQALARTAQQGRRAKGVELGEMLDSLTAETFEAALETCRNITARLLEQHVRLSQPSFSKPPARSDDFVAASLKKLA